MVHLSCAGLDDETDKSEDWWCSQDCKSSGRSQYCHCGRFLPGEQSIHCSRGVECKGFEIYHKSCLNIKRKPGSYLNFSNI